jgi:hypothetical protein
MILVRTFISSSASVYLQYPRAGSWAPPSAPIPEDAPAASAHLPAESAYFLAANRNKRSLTVNFKKPEGLEIMKKLVQKADVMVENYVPGKLWVIPSVRASHFTDTCSQHDYGSGVRSMS